MSTGTELLADIQEVFKAKRVDRICSADLIAALCDDDEKVWSTYNRGKPISQKQVSKRLAEYSIRTKNVRIGHEQAKGFEVEQFQEAFSRYLSNPSEDPSQRPKSPETSNGGGFAGTDSGIATVAGNQSVPRKTPPALGWDGGTDKKGVAEEISRSASYV